MINPIPEEIVFWSFWHRKKPDIKEWHITANESGAIALRSYLHSIVSGGGLYKSMRLSENTDAVKIAGNKNKATFGKMLNLRFDSVDPEQFAITDEMGNITLLFGEKMRLKLIEGMTDILNDRAGAPIGENVLLHFWWWTA